MELHGKIKVVRLAGIVNTGQGRPNGNLQAKTVHPSRFQQVVEPDSGYMGLSRVTVEAPQQQAKTVAPGTSVQVVTPDADYVGLSSVTVAAAPLQNKTVEVAPVPQIITPDAGFYGLGRVWVAGLPDAREGLF